MKIAVIDPGETTGFVVVQDDKVIYAEHLRGLLPVWLALQEHIPDIVIYEEFVLYGSHAKQSIGSEFFTVQVVGIIKLYCELLGTKIVKSRAANMYAPSGKLLSLGSLSTSVIGKHHCQQALRHYVAYKEKMNT